MQQGTTKIKHVNEWFEGRVNAYLRQYCTENPEWAVNLANDGKNIIDCVNYILWKTSTSHYNPETDMTPCASEEEQYAWAVEYYEDTNLKNSDIKSPFAQAKAASSTSKKTKKKDGKKEEETPSMFDMEVSEPTPEEVEQAEKATAEGKSVYMFPAESVEDDEDDL